MRRWRTAMVLTVAISATSSFTFGTFDAVMFGQDRQSSAPASSGDSASPSLPDPVDSFPAPDSSSLGNMPRTRGFGSSGRGFGNSGGDPLFPFGRGGSSTRGGLSSKNDAAANDAAANGKNGSFDWTRFFDDAVRSGFQCAAPRLSASGMRPVGGGGSLVDLGDGLLHSASASSSGMLGSSLGLASEAAQIERRGLNFTLKEPDKNSDLGVKFSFKEEMGHNSLFGGGMGSGGNSFGTMNSFSSVGSSGFPNFSGLGSGPGSGLGSALGSGAGGRRGGGGGASSQVSVQFKF